MKLSTYNLKDKEDILNLICESDKVEIIEKPNYWEVIITIENYRIEANSSNEDVVCVKEYAYIDAYYIKEIKLPLLYESIVTDIVNGYLEVQA